MACHILGTPAMVLHLTAPAGVECIKQEGKGKHTFPKGSVIRFEFPARGSMPPVTVFRHDGLLKQPDIEGDARGRAPGRLRLQRSTSCPSPSSRVLQAITAPESGPAKGAEPACSNFSIAGPFVQWVLVGVISMRFEGKLAWDAACGRFTNNDEANEYLKPEFRKGWKFA